MYKECWDILSNKKASCIIKMKKNKNGEFIAYLVIPFDEKNAHYQEYLAWLEEGNKPQPADIPKAD